LGDRVADQLCVIETLKENPEKQYGETAEVDDCRRNIIAARQGASAYLFPHEQKPPEESVEASRSACVHQVPCHTQLRYVLQLFRTSICPSEADSMSIVRFQNADLPESACHYLFRIGCWGRSRRVAGRLRIWDHHRRPRTKRREARWSVK